MKFTFDNTAPIYIQLVEQIKINIISGALSPGERLPSIRDLALYTKVNPNTMQKALSELEEQGLIFTERTNGKFVTEEESLIATLKEQYANKTANEFFNNMSNLGFNIEAAIKYLENMKGR